MSVQDADGCQLGSDRKAHGAARRHAMLERALSLNGNPAPEPIEIPLPDPSVAPLSEAA